MTQNFHTAIGVGDPWNANIVNVPLSELDSAITQRTAAFTTKGDLLAFNGSQPVVVPILAGGFFLMADSTADAGVSWVRLMPAYYISGLAVDCDGTDVTIGIGACGDGGNSRTMINGSTITIDPDTVGANGLDSGSLSANTWYYVWLIQNLETFNVRGLLSTSPTSPTMPTGYTLKRRIGSVLCGSAGTLLKQRMDGVGVMRRVVYLEDTTATPFKVMDEKNVSNASWDTINLIGCVPSTANTVFGYFSRANAGGVLTVRSDSDQVLQLCGVGAREFYVELPIASTAFDIKSDASGDEDAIFHVWGYTESVRS
ncbi:MAG: hypothetical protein K8L99_26235 [Anaerolineae bacterium]|nr:hypothetical protein [Anaerolineae bacterium]